MGNGGIGSLMKIVKKRGEYTGTVSTVLSSYGMDDTSAGRARLVYSTTITSCHLFSGGYERDSMCRKDIFI